MPDLFVQIRDAWRALESGPRAEEVLDRWQESSQQLASLDRLASVVDAARSERDRQYDARDDIQRALLALAATDADARLAMLEILRPGLTLVARAYIGRWRSEAASMVVTAALERIGGFRGGPSVRPAANIVLGVRNDLFRQRLREDAELSALGTPSGSGGHYRDPGTQSVAPGEELLGIVSDAVRDGRITTNAARLILLHRVCGVSTRELAVAEGREVGSVRKSRNRAEAALAACVEAVA